MKSFGGWCLVGTGLALLNIVTAMHAPLLWFIAIVGAEAIVGGVVLLALENADKSRRRRY